LFPIGLLVTKQEVGEVQAFSGTKPFLSPLCRHILGLAVACHGLLQELGGLKQDQRNPLIHS
jgi:hypothetical protein